MLFFADTIEAHVCAECFNPLVMVIKERVSIPWK
jgi:hypothetical protein